MLLITDKDFTAKGNAMLIASFTSTHPVYSVKDTRFLLSSIAVLYVLIVAGAVWAAGDDDLLAKADAFRVPYDEVELNATLTVRTDGVIEKTERYLVQNKGTQLSRVTMLDPDKQRQKVLMTDNGMWLQSIGSGRAIRITPLQRLMGQASFGDIGRMRWAGDYAVESAIDDNTGTVKARRLTLTAKSGSAVYPQIALWVEAKVGRPLKAEFFLDSGKMFKTATFAAPVAVGNARIVTSVTFSDALSPGKSTEMVVGEFLQRTFPPAVFTLSGFGID